MNTTLVFHDLKHVLEMLGMSRSGWDNLVRTHAAPPFVRLGIGPNSRIKILDADLNAWIMKLRQEQNPGAPLPAASPEPEAPTPRHVKARERAAAARARRKAAPATSEAPADDSRKAG